MEKSHVIKKLNNIFHTRDVKNIYLDKGQNPYSSNYMIKTLVNDGDIIKLANGIYSKSNYSISEKDVSEIFVNKNDDFLFVTSNDLNDYSLTNQLFEKGIIIIKQRLFKNKEKLIRLFKEKDLIEYIIVPSKFENKNLSLDNYLLVHLSKYLSDKEDYYLENYKKLLNGLDTYKIQIIMENLKFTAWEKERLNKIIYG